MNNNIVLSSVRGFRPGDVVAVIYDTYNHYAIVSDRRVDGLPNLIALTRRKGNVCEESWAAGTQGATVRKSHIKGFLPADKILGKARSMIGKKRYDLFSDNCEHFVRWAHGLPVESKQVVGGVAGSLVFGAAGYALSEGHKGWALGLAALGAVMGIAAANQGS